MAKITDYPSITTIDANTILLADGSSGTGKILASDMAKYALETYAGSTLAGSAQSVKNAFNLLNSNNVYVNSVATLNNALNAVQAAKGILVQAYSNAVVNVLAGETLSSKTNMKAWFSRQSSTVYMYTMNVMDTEYTYTGVYNPTTSTASKIVKKPTRAEIDNAYFLNAAKTSIPTNADLNTYKTPGRYYCINSATATSLSNCPVAAGFTLRIETMGADWIRQIIDVAAVTGIVQWQRLLNPSTNTWSSWVQLPTRSEVDALSSKSAWISSTPGWVAIAANSSKTFDVPNVSKAIIIVMQGASVNNYGMYFLNATGSGAVTTKAISDNTNATISTATNKVTITTGAASGNSYVTFLVFGGTGITAE